MKITRRFRSLVAMLLTLCMVSASQWAYSAEALADALSDEAVVLSVDGGYGEHTPAGSTCNHGCHAVTHLIGLESSMPSVGRSVALAMPPASFLFIIPVQSRDGPFRPPRSAFQA